MKRKFLFCATCFVFANFVLPARAELVVIVNPKSGAGTMSNSQIAQFFLGGSVTFVPIEQTDSSPLRAEFCKKVLGKEPNQVQAVWARIVFTGKGSPPKIMKSSEEVKKAVIENMNAIGYIEKSAADDSVKIVALIQ